MRLTREQFRDALRKGLGRAAIHVRLHGDEDVRDDLLEACLRDVAIDAQCEGNRGEWLYSIIELTKDVGFYRDPVLRALADLHPDRDTTWTASQLFAIAANFAEDGYSEARQIIYEVFDRQLYRT